MYHYNYETLVNERQKELNKISKEAWKFTAADNDSWIRKIFKKFRAVQHQKQRKQAILCECYGGK